MHRFGYMSILQLFLQKLFKKPSLLGIMVVYVFNLKQAISPGLKNNNVFPELAAIYNFLSGLNGTEYQAKEQFKEALEEFPSYLEKQRLRRGTDSKLRAGLKVLPDGTVGSERTGGFCPYGRLEELVE
jgi:hypothetical protein